MRFYMKRIPELNMRKESTPNRYKISLYSFKDFAFTRAAKKFDTDFARELKGDRTTQYSNYTIEEKKEMYRELEPELTIFNAEGIRRDLEAKYSTQARELQELREKEQGKEKEIEALRHEVGEMKVGVLFLGEVNLAVALKLRPEAHGVGNPHARVQEDRQRQPRLGAARVPRLVLPDFLARPGVEAGRVVAR